MALSSRRRNLRKLPANLSRPTAARERAMQRRGFVRRAQASPGHIARWTRQLAMLLRAGIPLVRALASPVLSAPQGWNKPSIHALADVRRDVERGVGLSAALARHPSLFDEFAVQIVAAGELTGALDAALERIAVRAERSDGLRRTLRQALIYPAIVVLVAVGTVAALLVFVIPIFTEIFAESGEALPLPTRIVVQLSEWTIVSGPFVILLAPVALTVRVLARHQPGVRAWFERIWFSMPVFGPIVRATAVSNSLETLGGLVAGGIPLYDALEIAARTAGNGVIANELESARQRIGAGSALAEALEGTARMPSLATQMIAAGEETGALDTVLENTAGIFREEADRQVAVLLALLEPVIVLVLAGGVGGVVVAMYLPIFRLGAVIG